MDPKFKEHESLINLMESAQRPSAREDFTERVMARLEGSAHAVSAWPGRGVSEGSLFPKAGSVLWGLSGEECPFCFLVSGMFLLLLGAVVVFGVAMLGILSQGAWTILLAAAMILFSSLTLIAAAYIVAKDPLGGYSMARKILHVYGVMILAGAFTLQAAIKTHPGEIIALAYGTTGLVMGMMLYHSIRNRREGQGGTLQEEKL